MYLNGARAIVMTANHGNAVCRPCFMPPSTESMLVAGYPLGISMTIENFALFSAGADYLSLHAKVAQCPLIQGHGYI